MSDFFILCFILSFNTEFEFEVFELFEFELKFVIFINFWEVNIGQGAKKFTWKSCKIADEKSMKYVIYLLPKYRPHFQVITQ